MQPRHGISGAAGGLKVLAWAELLSFPMLLASKRVLEAHEGSKGYSPLTEEPACCGLGLLLPLSCKTTEGPELCSAHGLQPCGSCPTFLP